MRILHFSDFHLNGKKISDAEHILNYMLEALKKINKEKPIELVVFSGDMLDKGGEGYEKKLIKGFYDFKEKVITPIMKVLNLPLSRFVFTPGNHDVDFDADDEMMEAGIEEKTKEYNDIINFAKSPKIEKYTTRINEFKKFEREYYCQLQNEVEYDGSRFLSTFEYDLNGCSIGISSLNNVWRCGYNDKDKIVLGIHQITEDISHLENKDLKIAVMHYPIEFLKETERRHVMELCAKNFDIVFCGHSHQGYINLHVPLKNYCFLEINAAGTLSTNTFTNDIRFQNSFQIVDCEENCYSIQKYYQKKFQEFELYVTPEFPDGKNARINLNKESFDDLYDEYQRKTAERENRLVKRQILPFEPISDFANRTDNEVMKSKFHSSETLDEIRNNILYSKHNCRLMALSGMGKTRIIAETFKDSQNVYYSREGECNEGLNALLKYCNPEVVIIDNCNHDLMVKAIKCIDETGKKVRLITIYNILKPEEQSLKGELYKLDYNITEEIIEKMIAAETDISKDEYIVNAIKERSGNIPYMTLLLISAYKMNKNLMIDNSNGLLSSILKGDESLSENKEKVLKTLSLFEPLGCDGMYKDEFDLIVNMEKIHHIDLEQNKINLLFNDTIKEYENRQLIEKEACFIRIRPRPLAEWLVESWLVQFGDSIADIIEEISNKENSLSERLFKALNNRFREMSSQNAKKVFNKLNNPENGSFHNERIVFSKAGSQLFLSMGLVSPVMVAQNLLTIIEAKSIEWLRDEMDKDVRRNIVWALENICIDNEAFIFGAKCLARLAIAENEHWANNATGQFLQLFHILLSGTKANLGKRIELIKELKNNKLYFPLLIKAVGSAFTSSGFYRSNTNSGSYYTDNLYDYRPSISEVKSYWKDCIDILISITEKNKDLNSIVIDFLPKYVSDFARMNEMSLLYKLVYHYGDIVDFQWPDMRDSLSKCLDYWFKGTEDEKIELNNLLIKLSPKTLLGKIKASLIDNKYKIEGDYEAYGQKMINLMDPLADEFLELINIDIDEIEKIIIDKELQFTWFIKSLSQKMNEKSLAHNVFNSILEVVLRQPDDFECNIIPLLANLTEDHKIVNNFKSELIRYNRRYLYSSVIGYLDSDEYMLLKELLEGYKSNSFDNHCINNYLRNCKFYSNHNVLDIFELLKDASVSDSEVSYPYVINHMLYNINFEDNDELSRYKTILLSFKFEDSNSHLTSTVVDSICNILKNTDDNKFAKAINDKIVEYVSIPGSLTHYFDKLYYTLLPKYQKVILDDLCSILSSNDDNALFFYKMYNYLGSGFDFGSGPLFQCNNEKLKEACLKHPTVLPQRLAQMCPVYHYTEEGEKDSFSDFFIWLCDNFGDQREMLQAFSANMNTFGWSGVTGFSDFIEESISCLQLLLTHNNYNVREWAKSEIKSIQEDVNIERNKEAYYKLTR